jgi:UDP-glucose 4-epimerase
VSVYVVTGGAGFIGSSIVERLVRDGEYVRVVDDLSTGRRDNLGVLQSEVHFYEGSVCNAELLRDAFEGADYVLHQAALASVQGSIDDPTKTNQVNVGGTLNVLMVARECGVKRVVYASSSSVYGTGAEQPKREDMMPAPASPYAVSKLVGEHYCGAYSSLFGLETVCLRYFNVFGPRQDPHSQYAAVIPMFIRTIQEGGSPRVFGDGEQSRDFVFVEDVGEANLRAARIPGAAGAVLNIGSGERCTVNVLLGLLQRLTGKAVEPEHCAPRPGDVRHSQADISKAQRAIGYRPRVSFEDGLRRTTEWYEGKDATTFYMTEPKA